MEGPIDIARDLTAFEIIELYYLQRELIISEVSVFMSSLFAFIVAGYLVADKLTKSEAIAVSTLYSVFCLFTISGITTMLLANLETANIAVGPSSSIVVYFAPVLFLSAMIYSLFFFYKRHIKGRGT